jgi:hypothetical protein
MPPDCRFSGARTSSDLGAGAAGVMMLVIGLAILGLLTAGSIRKDFKRWPVASKLIWLGAIIAIYHYW